MNRKWVVDTTFEAFGASSHGGGGGGAFSSAAAGRAQAATAFGAGAVAAQGAGLGCLFVDHLGAETQGSGWYFLAADRDEPLATTVGEALALRQHRGLVPVVVPQVLPATPMERA